ncbi:MAG: queuosine salvage family protein, partial [Chloroflexota bacterium]|nr:queuosine salvage family protein [Chloroflexota bacterium]
MTPEPVIGEHVLGRAGPGPLGILSSCAVVVNDSLHVTIDTAAIDRLAGDLVHRQIPAPVWDEDVHYRGTGVQATERTIGWIFVLDALNFCFWGQDPDPSYRWRIQSQGVVHDGYMALAIALRDAARAGTPIWDPAWQVMVDEDTISRIFRPPAGSTPIPLLRERAAHLRELGERMAPLGENHPYTTFVERAKGSALELVEAIVDTFPSFRDVARWTPTSGLEPAIEVRLFKRAQILVSDLAGALAGSGELVTEGRDRLTAFADYKVPQVLRHVGILRYGDELAARIRARELIERGSREEIEIRAATIWACDLIRQRLSDLGTWFTASDVDWLLWNLGQSL